MRVRTFISLVSVVSATALVFAPGCSSNPGGENTAQGSQAVTGTLPAGCANPQEIQDLGYPELRSYADVNGDGIQDYCRLLGDAPNIYVSCQLGCPGGLYGIRNGFDSYAAIDLGYGGSSVMRDVNGDGRADYCRTVSINNKRVFACDPALPKTNAELQADPHGFSENNYSIVLPLPDGCAGTPYPITDLGYPYFRQYADANGDGVADYCRFVGDVPNIFLSCQLGCAGGGYGVPDGYNSTPGIDIGQSWAMRDVNADGRADFCRTVVHNGANRVACDLSLPKSNSDLTSNPQGFDSDQYNSFVLPVPGCDAPVPLTDMGYPYFRANADVNGDGTDDYCRFVGDGANAYLSCQLQCPQGNYAGDFRSIQGIDQGIAGTPFMRDVNGDGRADFCRTVVINGTRSGKCDLATANGFDGNQYGFDLPLVPHTLNVGADLFTAELISKVKNVRAQISQNFGKAEVVQKYGSVCQLDVAAIDACKALCVGLPDTSKHGGLTRVQCEKNCAAEQPIKCSAPSCHAELIRTFIYIPPELAGGTNACDSNDPTDCLCVKGQKPALATHALDLADPIYSEKKGLITYHCRMNELVFTASENPVTLFSNGIQIHFSGVSKQSPALSCDNGVPDLDLSSTVMGIELTPKVVGGNLVTTARGYFATSTHAHTLGAQGAADIDDMDAKVNNLSQTAINGEAQGLAGPLGNSLDSSIKAQLPTGAMLTGIDIELDHVTIFYNTY